MSGQKKRGSDAAAIQKKNSMSVSLPLFSSLLLAAAAAVLLHD